MEYVVDFQAFKAPANEFVVKELAILPLGSSQKPAHYVFQPPCEWSDLSPKCRAENFWLERNHLQMSWDSGDIPYDHIQVILQSSLFDAKNIYVKGPEKAQWLRRHVEHVNDMGEISTCPALRKMREWKIPESLCTYHPKPGMVCAAQNVLLLERYILMNYPSLERSLDIFHKMKHLSFMETEDIAKLPAEFIINYAAESVDAAWNKLPECHKRNSEILMCVKCRIHDHSDRRVPPMIRECRNCMKYWFHERNFSM